MALAAVVEIVKKLIKTDLIEGGIKVLLSLQAEMDH